MVMALIITENLLFRSDTGLISPRTGLKGKMTDQN